MRSLVLPRLDCFVGDEPRVTATAQIRTTGVFPSFDIRLVCVGHACSAAIELDLSALGQVKDVFVAVVDVAVGIDGPEVAGADCLGSGRLNADGLDPVECVLKLEEFRGGEGEEELVGQEGIAWRASQVQEKRTVHAQDAMNLAGPIHTPREKTFAWRGVVVAPVVDPEIVGRGGDHQVDAFRREFPHALEAIAVMKVDRGGQALPG